MKPSLLLALLAAVAAPPPPAPAQTASRPNVVFIMADDLGHTDLACQGSRYYETPNIDRMALQGMRFTNGYSCGPNCQPTRAALMTGQYGPRTGIYTVGSIDRFDWRTRPLKPVDNGENLPLSKTTIAQTMKAAGYATALYGKWHLGQTGEHHPSQRGFDEAIVSMGKHFDFTTSPKVDVPEGAYLADFLTDRAVDFITRHKDGPFFVALHHFGVHAPHQAKPDLIARFRDKPPVGGQHDPTYAAMIASVDESVGRVLKTIDDLKLGEKTLVIFTSDNGGVGGYAAIQKDNGITDNAPLRGGKGMLYEGGIRVPYIFRWTGTIEPATTCPEPINSVDFHPALIDLANARGPAHTPLDGVSYLSYLKGGENSPGRDCLFWHFPGYLGAGQGGWRTTPAGAIRKGDWKLIEFFETGKLELYNLKDDLGETRDRAADQPEVVKDLHARLVAWRASVKAPMPTPHTPEPASPKAKKKKNQADVD